MNEKLKTAAKEFCRENGIVITEKTIHHTDRESETVCYPIDGMITFAQSLIDKGVLIEAEKWISVKDSMPPCNIPVLVSVPGRVTGKQFLKVDEYIDKEWRFTSGGITHWMPLPAAPEESTLSSAGKEVTNEEAEALALKAYCIQSESEGFMYTIDDDKCSLDKSNGYVTGFLNGYKEALLKFKSSPASTVEVISNEEIYHYATKIRIYRDPTEKRRITKARVEAIEWYRK